jgi:hypothetical protein
MLARAPKSGSPAHAEHTVIPIYPVKGGANAMHRLFHLDGQKYLWERIWNLAWPENMIVVKIHGFPDTVTIPEQLGKQWWKDIRKALATDASNLYAQALALYNRPRNSDGESGPPEARKSFVLSHHHGPPIDIYPVCHEGRDSRVD